MGKRERNILDFLFVSWYLARTYYFINYWGLKESKFRLTTKVTEWGIYFSLIFAFLNLFRNNLQNF